MTKRQKTGGVVAGLVLAAGGMLAGSTVADVTPTEEPPVAVGPDVQQVLGADEYIGPCSIVTPPEPDPCEAAQLVIRYQMTSSLVNADYFQRWAKTAPLDYQRLTSIVMLAPRCSTPSSPQPQVMKTWFGAALADAFQAYACAKGTEAITWPAANPPPLAGSSDKTPPRAPGPLQLTPGG